MAITVRATSAGPNSNSTTTSISLPSGTTTGDVTVIGYVHTNIATTTTLTGPAGWTVLFADAHNLICWRAFQSGDATTGIAAVSDSSNWWESLAVTYTGLDTTNPVDAFNFFTNVSANPNGAPTNNLYRAPTLNPNYAGSRLLCIFAENGSSGGTLALPSGLTAQVATGNGPLMRMADKALTDGTPTGDFNSSIGSAGTNVHFGAQIALKASGAAATTVAAAYPRIAGIKNFDLSTNSQALDLLQLNVQDGDLVVFFCANGATTAGTVSSPPSGYTAQTNTLSACVYTHLWSTGDTKTPTFGFSGTTGFRNMLVLLIRKVGVSASGVSVDLCDVARVTGSSPLSVTSNSITPATAYDLLIEYIAGGGGGATPSGTWSALSNTGLTDEDVMSAGPCSRLSWLQPASNPTGTFAATLTTTSLSELSATTLLFKIGAGAGAVARPVVFICT